ncbi:MAG TPA: ethanolamine ammonia-lyase subunit EutC [Polyangia bacterium]|nr:ethanolamine ammonia-lyase subunit EutC [Polyangia bacterium]
MIDRNRIAELVRAALEERVGAEAAAARARDSSGALLLRPDRGVNLGAPFDPPTMARLLQVTPARIAVGRTGAGTRYRTNTLLRFRADHAVAKDAVMSEVDAALIERLGLSEVRTRATDKPMFLQRPDAGRTLSEPARAQLAAQLPRAPKLVVIYGDGLSAAAINQHLPTFHEALLRELAARGIPHPPPLFVRYARVKVMDEIARLCGAEAALFVCGERPGLGFADSLSAYYIYNPREGATDADREVISNINPRGVPPAEGARRAAEALVRVLREQKSGVVVG